MPEGDRKRWTAVMVVEGEEDVRFSRQKLYVHTVRDKGGGSGSGGRERERERMGKGDFYAHTGNDTA